MRHYGRACARKHQRIAAAAGLNAFPCGMTRMHESKAGAGLRFSISAIGTVRGRNPRDIPQHVFVPAAEK